MPKQPTHSFTHSLTTHTPNRVGRKWIEMSSKIFRTYGHVRWLLLLFVIVAVPIYLLCVYFFFFLLLCVCVVSVSCMVCVPRAVILVRVNSTSVRSSFFFYFIIIIFIVVLVRHFVYNNWRTWRAQIQCTQFAHSIEFVMRISNARENYSIALCVFQSVNFAWAQNSMKKKINTNKNHHKSYTQQQ